MAGNFFGGAFFGGGFFGQLPVQSGGHGQGEEGREIEDVYSEPRRVVIAGKAFTVRSKSQYLGLLAKYSRKPKANRARTAEKQASQIVEEAREKAREALSAKQIEETATLIRLALEKRKRTELPVEVLMLIADDL